jgi:opacity protein-like surface antigen
VQFAAASLLAPQLTAQRSTTRGLSLGLAVMGTSLDVENGDRSTGSALGLQVGYGFNRIITGYLHVDGGEIEVAKGAALSGKWSLGHAEIGARFHLGNSLHRVRPYLETALGARVVSVENAQSENATANKVSFSGGAFTLGAGVATYFKPSLALDVGLKFTGGSFSEIDFGSVAVKNLDIKASSVRFGVGLTWWP